jgi:DNA-binding Xre family transcriptional regulator
VGGPSYSELVNVELLKQIMDARSLTIKGLAQKAELSDRTIRKAINGKAIHELTLKMMAKALEIQPDRLIDYRRKEQTKKHQRPTSKVAGRIAGPLQVFIDSDAYSAADKGELLSLLSDLYELETGDRLVLDATGFMEPVAVSNQ